MSEQRLSFWLVPAEDEYLVLSGIIREVAGKLDSPVFEPHVTVFLTHGDDEKGRRILDQSALRFGPITLDAGELRCGDVFSKTLFLTFKPSKDIEALSAFIGDTAGKKKNYKLEPHLSLAYKDLSRKYREALRREVKVPLGRIRFDRLRAIASERFTTTAGDVAAWRVIAEAGLLK